MISDKKHEIIVKSAFMLGLSCGIAVAGLIVGIIVIILTVNPPPK
jgi:tetrahydromethanopterin S-methyltransferase subunit F